MDVKPEVVDAKIPAEKGVISEKTNGAIMKKEIVPQKRLNKRNTAIKFLLDQTVGALFNTVVFLAGMPALNGATTDVIMAKVKKVCSVSNLDGHM